MNFSHIAQQFSQAEPGTDAFKNLSNQSFLLMQQDTAHASLYFIIAMIAKAYVSRYEDQAVAQELALSAKSTVQEFNTKVVQALHSSSEDKLRLLNEIAIAYQFHNDRF